MTTRYHLHIIGKVQGVYFRAATLQEAEKLGLKGWIQNLSDGSVETLFEGPEEQANALLAWCEKGPPHAQVAHVIRLQPPNPEPLSSFCIR